METLEAPPMPTQEAQKIEWINTNKAAEHLGVSRRTLVRWVSEGQLPEHSRKRMYTARGYQHFFDLKEILVFKAKKAEEKINDSGQMSGRLCGHDNMDAHKTARERNEWAPELYSKFEEQQKRITEFQLRFTEQLAKEKAKNASKRTTIFFLVPILLLTLAGLGFSSWKAYNFYLTNQKNTTEYQNEKQNLISTHKEELSQTKQEYIKTTTSLTAKIDSLNENITTKQIEIENLKQVSQQLKMKNN
mgnify:CR=1 FL=1